MTARFFLLGEGYEGFEAGAGRAGIDGLSGEADSLDKIAGVAGGDESCGGIREHDIAVRPMLVRRVTMPQDMLDDLRVVLRVSAANAFEWGAAQAEIFRRDAVAADRSIAEFGDVRVA